MKGYNHVTLVGNVASIKMFEQESQNLNKHIKSFMLAVNRSCNRTGEEIDYITINVNSSISEVLKENLNINDRVLVDGKLIVIQELNRFTTSVVADEITILGKTKGDSSENTHITQPKNKDS